MEDEDEEMLDSDEERERKVAGLEAELDGMYDMYQERMKERDAKFKVTEERRKHGQLEEWHGIQEKDSDEEDSDRGGRRMGQDGGSEGESWRDSSSDESDERMTTKHTGPEQKRRRNEPPRTSVKTSEVIDKA
jgi:AdoMet-dependent rRNA methyltransferase SPB1